MSDYRPNLTYGTSSSADSYQDNNKYKTNTVYWFKYEPLKWVVLSQDDDGLFVMSAKVIDSIHRRGISRIVANRMCRVKRRKSDRFVGLFATTYSNAFENGVKDVELLGGY